MRQLLKKKCTQCFYKNIQMSWTILYKKVTHAIVEFFLNEQGDKK